MARIYIVGYGGAYYHIDTYDVNPWQHREQAFDWFEKLLADNIVYKKRYRLINAVSNLSEVPKEVACTIQQPLKEISFVEFVKRFMGKTQFRIRWEMYDELNHVTNRIPEWVSLLQAYSNNMDDLIFTDCMQKRVVEEFKNHAFYKGASLPSIIMYFVYNYVASVMNLSSIIDGLPYAPFFRPAITQLGFANYIQHTNRGRPFAAHRQIAQFILYQKKLRNNLILSNSYLIHYLIGLLERVNKHVSERSLRNPGIVDWNDILCELYAIAIMYEDFGAFLAASRAIYRLQRIFKKYLKGEQ